MTKMPSIARRGLAAVASVFLIAIAVSGASGQTTLADPPAKLADFQGAWVGHSVPGSVDDRAATVNIQPLDSGGFTITWSSFEGESEGTRRKVMTRERTMRFEPSGRSGVWRGAGSRDPVRGPASWARLHDRSLTVNLVQVTDASKCNAVQDGWHFDDPDRPTRIVLCASTCTSANDAADAKIEALTGCKAPAPT